MRATEEDSTPDSQSSFRWTHYRKERLLLALRAGELSQQQAYRRYALSPDELIEWQRRYDAAGVEGLRARRRSSR